MVQTILSQNTTDKQSHAAMPVVAPPPAPPTPHRCARMGERFVWLVRLSCTRLFAPRLYQLGARLGRGAYGAVHAAELTCSPLPRSPPLVVRVSLHPFFPTCHIPTCSSLSHAIVSHVCRTPSSPTCPSPILLLFFLFLFLFSYFVGEAHLERTLSLCVCQPAGGLY